ncbi:MAG: hypothetical protein AB1540_09200 [Bdellovibrionota bacterium]
MLKRKLYWVAIGLAASQLSIAELGLLGAGPVTSFGDCVGCHTQAVDFPITPSNLSGLINQNLVGTDSAFVNPGQGIAGLQKDTLTNLAAGLRARADRGPLVHQAPIRPYEWPLDERLRIVQAFHPVADRARLSWAEEARIINEALGTNLSDKVFDPVKAYYYAR